jgi:hypothetical protein
VRPARAPRKRPTRRPSIWERETPTGDWGGARTALKDKGIDVTLNYIGEAFAVMSGGLQRQASYEGRLEFFARRRSAEADRLDRQHRACDRVPDSR